jgi:hypothetical protein
MITIQSEFASYPQTMCEYQASKDGRYAWFLCTAHEEKNLALEEIQAEVKLEILNANVLNISKLEVENWMKTFFADFHWKLHASLRRTDLQEKGLSLFFAVLFDSDIYFVQFGRVFCAVTKGRKLDILGKSWKNFHVQSVKDLNLIGLLEGDIKVRPQQFRLSENESMFLLSGKIAGKVLDRDRDPGSLIPLIETYGNADPALWLVMKNVPQIPKAKKRRLSKLEVTTLILLLGTVLAILYMAFGNRIIDVMLHRTRKEVAVTQLRTTSVILENLGKVVNFPARSIELLVGWKAELPYNITAAPAFNQQQILLASGNQLYAYDIGERKLLWNKSYPAAVESVLSTALGLELSLDDKTTLGLDRDGNQTWIQTLDKIGGNDALCSREITSAEDKRIDRGITVVPLKRGIAVLDSQQGIVMSELRLNDNLRYLSQYDDINNCFYAVVGKTLVCIKLEIVN